MSYSLPTFNLPVNIWHNYDNSTNAYLVPDVVTTCNMAVGRRVTAGVPNPGSVFSTPMLDVLFPPLTDVRVISDIQPLADIMEIPAGSGAFFLVHNVYDLGKGFANEHRAATSERWRGTTNWGDVAPMAFFYPLP